MIFQSRSERRVRAFRNVFRGAVKYLIRKIIAKENACNKSVETSAHLGFSL